MKVPIQLHRSVSESVPFITFTPSLNFLFQLSRVEHRPLTLNLGSVLVVWIVMSGIKKLAVDKIMRDISFPRETKSRGDLDQAVPEHGIHLSLFPC